MAERLEAAYHEKLTQHIQQTFLASQAYNHALAAANGFQNRSMMPGNGHSGGPLEQMISQVKETHENMSNGRANGHFAAFDSTDSSPKDLVINTNKSNGAELDLITDLSVKQEQQTNGSSIMDETD